MNALLRGILAVLVFGLIISVWNWVTSTLPGQPGSRLDWIFFLVGAIAAIVVYLKTGDDGL